MRYRVLRQHGSTYDAQPVRAGSYPPTLSLKHLVVKLVLAAPDSFLAPAAWWQALVASDSHRFMKLARAAPASFFSPALALQLAV